MTWRRLPGRRATARGEEVRQEGVGASRFRKRGPIAVVVLALVGTCAGLAVHYWPAPRNVQPAIGVPGLHLSDPVMRSATILVFGPTATYHVQRVWASPNLDRSVDRSDRGSSTARRGAGGIQG